MDESKHAGERVEEKNTAISISFNKAKSKVQLEKSSLRFAAGDVKEGSDDEKDYIVSAEGNALKSVKTKYNPQTAAIPLAKNTWSVASSHLDDLSKEAISALIDEAKDNMGRSLSSPGNDAVIPLQSRVPVTSRTEQIPAGLAQESALEEYELMPVECFGKAMLRGMGWKEGDPVGLTNKQVVKPVELRPHLKGLGLGATPRIDDPRLAKKRKAGEAVEVTGPKSKSEQRPWGHYVGNAVLIESGPHKGLVGKIVHVNEDVVRITVKLAISGEKHSALTPHSGNTGRSERLTSGCSRVELSQYETKLIDDEEYLELLQGPGKKSNTDQAKGPSCNQTSYGRTPPSHQDKSEVLRKSYSGWIRPGIKVRVVSDTFMNGKLYNKKVDVVDVVSRGRCTCQTDSGKLIEGVKESILETLVPRQCSASVMVVLGSHTGKIGRILERDPDRCIAQVQLHSGTVEALSYDYISEYIGSTADYSIDD